MKKMFWLCLLLMGCTTTGSNEHYAISNKEKETSDRLAACKGFSEKFSHDAAWIAGCMKSDTAFEMAFREEIASWDRQKACNFSLTNWPSGSAQLAGDVILKSGRDCKEFVPQARSTLTQVATSSSVTQLCGVWAAGSSNILLQEAVLGEIKKRSVDCAAILASAQQSKIQQANLQSMQKAESQAQWQAFNQALQSLIFATQAHQQQTYQNAFMRQQIIGRLNKPTYNTHCQRSYNGVDCQTKQAPDFGASLAY